MKSVSRSATQRIEERLLAGTVTSPTPTVSVEIATRCCDTNRSSAIPWSLLPVGILARGLGWVKGSE